MGLISGTGVCSKLDSAASSFPFSGELIPLKKEALSSSIFVSMCGSSVLISSYFPKELELLSKTTPMWRKQTMHPEKIHFPLPSPGTAKEWDCSFLLLSIHTLKKGVYGKEKKKSISLLHWARSGKREMYFFWVDCPCSPYDGTVAP